MLEITHGLEDNTNMAPREMGCELDSSDTELGEIGTFL
jgi:hypothetical protein